MGSKIIETSFDRWSVSISVTMIGDLVVKAMRGGKPVKFDGSDLKSVEMIDETTYRNGGRAAAGAVIGGVLTGGIGLLAGAAFGGRRRTKATYLITFKSGGHIAFHEDRKNVVNYLNEFQVKSRIKDMRG